MSKIIHKMENYQFAEPFIQPVKEDVYTDYSRRIKNPMALTTINKNYDDGQYVDNTHLFIEHFRLIEHNCLIYNHSSSEIVKWAKHFGQYFEELLVKYVEKYSKSNEEATTISTKRKVSFNANSIKKTKK
jgi:hypothetical protein